MVEVCGISAAVRLALLAALLLVGCDGTETVDSRFATPERTVDTLFASYGMRDLSQADIQSRIAERGAFELRDEAAWRECFADLDQPAGQGMAGWVLGVLGAGRDELRFETAGEAAYVHVRDMRIVMRRERDGAYRIVLSDSVPERVREGLVVIEENARRRRVPPPGP